MRASIPRPLSSAARSRASAATSRSAGSLAAAVSWYTVSAARRPAAMPASALPVSLRPVSRKSTTASAIIGTITINAKNSRSLARKLTPGQSTSASHPSEALQRRYHGQASGL